MNLPNLITVARIGLALLVAPLILVEGVVPRLIAFVVFVAAALSDLWDGYLARSRGLVTDLGKLLDPLADKLLLVATFIPFYLVSHHTAEAGTFPWFGGILPLWIVIVIFGRELFITLFRSWAARRGVVMAAGPEGKFKTVFQCIFIGAAILWLALQVGAREGGWEGSLWRGWEWFHFGVSVASLSVALFLTVYSMIVYLWRYSRLSDG